ncbi:MAG TPA: alpha/beta hydrolase [Trebonia sp.]|jgi:pimeloyl-ACP methyl ester carboxylesterase
MDTVVLIHGGLWEDVGADWFWRRTGVVDGLAGRGLTVVAPDRLRRATSWADEAAQVATAVRGRPAGAGPGGAATRGAAAAMTVVGGSFGCAVAVRLALDFPELVGRLVLAWPAGLADQFTAIRLRAGLARLGAPASALNALLGTETVPSATDAELRTLAVPVGVLAATPPGPVHPRSTVDALLRLLPSAVELPGSPEAPRPEFPAQLESFIDVVAAFATG